ncbi:hypothetical protein LXL04_006126 [Taraxacum kok-saghyz]
MHWTKSKTNVNFKVKFLQPYTKEIKLKQFNQEACRRIRGRSYVMDIDGEKVGLVDLIWLKNSRPSFTIPPCTHADKTPTNVTSSGLTETDIRLNNNIASFALPLKA